MMKRIFIFMVAILLFISCSVMNHPPSDPENPFPHDGQTNIQLRPKLMWHVEDPDGDKMTFDLYLDTKNPPQELKGKGLSENEYYVKDKLSPGTKYYWKVVAKDSKGNSTKGPIWSFTTSAPPKIPYSPQPSNGSTNVSLNTKLSWSCDDPDDDVLTYDLYVGTGITLSLQAGNIIGHEYHLLNLSPGTKYYWQIVANDGKGNSTESPIWSFTTSHAPEIPFNPYPNDGSNNVALSVNAKWNCYDVDGDALKYDLYLGTTDSSMSILVRDLLKPEYTFKNLFAGVNYYWKVLAKDDKGNVSESPMWHFKTSVPPGVPYAPAPIDNSSDISLNVLLKWKVENPAMSDLSYDLYFGVENSLELIATGLKESSYMIHGLKGGTRYQWKVVVMDDKGNRVEGPVWSFTTSYPPVVPFDPHPADGDTDVSLTPELKWRCYDNDEGIVTYDIFIGVEKSKMNLMASDVSNSEFHVMNLEPGTKYYWKVVAKDDKGNIVEGPVWVFTTSYAPEIPYDPEPVNGSTNTSLDVKLSWRSSDIDGDTLVYDLFLGSGSSPMVLIAASLMENRYELKNLSSGVVYKWKVVAKDDKGNRVEGSVWSFTTSHAPEIPQALFPVDGMTEVATEITLNWDSEDIDGDNINYDLYFGRTTPPSIYKRNFSQKSYHLERLYENTNYYWQVVARDGKGNIVKSHLWSFKTVQGDSISPAGPHFVSKIISNDDTCAVTVKDNYAYIAAKAHFLVADVTDIESPQVIVDLNKFYDAEEVFVYDNYAYLMDKNTGIYVLDISDPRSPKVIGSMSYSGISDAFLYEGHLFIGCLGNVLILNLDDPGSPTEIASVTLSEYPYNIIVKNDILYVASYSFVTLIDISDVENPTKIGELTIENGDFSKIEAYGNYVYVTSHYNSIFIVDFSNPQDPKVIGNIRSFEFITDLYVKDDYLYVSDWNVGVDIFDISDAGSPEVLDKISVETPRSVFSNDHYLYVSNASNGVYIFDVLDPVSPKVIGTVDLPDRGFKVVVQDNYAYIADNNEGLVIVDVTAPSSPSIMSTVKNYGTHDVFVSGDYAYVSGDNFLIVNISDPRNPEVVSEVDSVAFALYVSRNYSYNISGNFVIFDVSDPADPEELNHMERFFSDVNISYSREVFVNNGILYIGAGSDGLCLSDVSKTYFEGHLSCFGAVVTSLYALGSYVYTTGDYDFVIFDISDIDNPKVVNTIQLSRRTNDVFVYDNYAFVAAGSCVLVFDVSDPSKVRLVGKIQLEDSYNEVISVYASGYYLYVTSDTRLFIVDLRY